MYIIGRCPGTINTQGWKGYSVSQMIPGLLEAVVFNGGLRFEISVEICGRGGVVMVVIKMIGAYL